MPERCSASMTVSSRERGETMGQILKIAWRNLWQHRTRTIVSGAVMFFGALLLLAGQAASSGITGSLETMVTGALTGDIVILSDKNEGRINLFDFKAMEMITNSGAVTRTITERIPDAGSSQMGKGIGLLDIGGGLPEIPTMILGVDGDRYTKSFPKFRLLEGTAPASGAAGLWLNETYIRIFLRGKVKTGDSIDFTAPTRGGFMNMSRIKVRGIYRLEGMEGLTSFINIMDIASYRRIFGMQIDAGALSRTAKKTIEQNKGLLDGDADPEKMLSTTVQDQSRLATAPGAQLPAAPTAGERELAARQNRQLAEYLAVKLKNPAGRQDAIDDLNRVFRERKLGVTAWSWRETAGPMGNMILMLQVILISLAVVIFAMLIIIIMNSMVMTAIERTYEVGTMRAIGATRGFVVRLFFTEALFLGGLFGGAGALTGALVLKAIPGIGAGESMVVRMLFGGPVLHIPVTLSQIAGTMLLILLVAALSSAYPAWIASRFQPVEAMNER